MASRESINRIRIEGWRVSRVPVAAAEDILQGDFMLWNDSVKQATKNSGTTSGGQFIGISDTKSHVETAGSTTFLSDTQADRINVVQQGLVEGIWKGGSTTLYPFQVVYLHSDSAQAIAGSGTGVVGIIDPAYGASGKAVVDGDLVKFWLRVPDAYRCFF